MMLDFGISDIALLETLKSTQLSENDMFEVKLEFVPQLKQQSFILRDQDKPLSASYEF